MYRNFSTCRKDEACQANQGRLWKDHADSPPWESRRIKEMNFRHGESVSNGSRDSSCYEQDRSWSQEDEGGWERFGDDEGVWERFRDDGGVWERFGDHNSRIWKTHSRPRRRRDSRGVISCERSRSRSWEVGNYGERTSSAGGSAGSCEGFGRNDRGRRRRDVNEKEGRKGKEIQSGDKEEYFELGRVGSDACFINNMTESRKLEADHKDLARDSSTSGYKCGDIQKRKRLFKEISLSGKAAVETNGEVSGVSKSVRLPKKKKKKNKGSKKVKNKGSKKSKNKENGIAIEFEIINLKQTITKELRKKVRYSQKERIYCMTTSPLSGETSKGTKRSETMRCGGGDTVSILKQQSRLTEKLSCCCFCESSHHEGAACPHLEENGTNPLVKRTGRKVKCGWCGSFNHFEISCPSTKEPIRDIPLFQATCRAYQIHRVVDGEEDLDEEEEVRGDTEEEVVKGCTMEGEERDLVVEEQGETTEDMGKEEEREDEAEKENETGVWPGESNSLVKMSYCDCNDLLTCCGICSGYCCCTFSPPASRSSDESAAGGERHEAGPEDCRGTSDSDVSLETVELRGRYRWAESEDNPGTLLPGGNKKHMTLDMIHNDILETSTPGEIFEKSSNNVETLVSEDNTVLSITKCPEIKNDPSDNNVNTYVMHSDTQPLQSNYVNLVSDLDSSNTSTIAGGKYFGNYMSANEATGDTIDTSPGSDHAGEVGGKTYGGNIIDIHMKNMEINTVEVSGSNKTLEINSPVKHENFSSTSNSSSEDIQQNIYESGGVDKHDTIPEATLSSTVALEPSNYESYFTVQSEESLMISAPLLVKPEEVPEISRVNITEERVEESVDGSNLDEINILDCRKKFIIITLDDDDNEEAYNKPDPEVFHHKDLRTKKNTQSPITKRMQEEIVSVMQGETGLIRTQLITQYDLFTLTGLNWLNDQVVEIYLSLVAERSLTEKFRAKHLPRIHCMSTYFFRNLVTRGFTSIARWTKDVDLFSYNLILVPVLIRKHWALVTVDLRTQSQGVFLYDSLVSSGKKMFSHTPVLASIMEYLKREQNRVCQEATDGPKADTKDKSDSAHLEPPKSRPTSCLNLSKFALHSLPCPQQENGSDCGVFVCQVAEYLARRKPLNFGQEDVPYLRRKMTWELIKNRILDPLED